MRRWARVARENDAAAARRKELWARLQALYAARAVVIQDRLIAEGKIRSPGKTEASQARYRSQIRQRMRNDPEAIKLTARYERFLGLSARIKKRRVDEYFAAAVKMIDDKATRRQKRWVWLEAREATADAV